MYFNLVSRISLTFILWIRLKGKIECNGYLITWNYFIIAINEA